MEAIAPFPNLPEELIKYIFEIACLNVDEADANDVGRRRGEGDATPRRKAAIERRKKSGQQLDVQMTIALMCVSRATYNLIAPLLYRTITLSRPSQLLCFAKTLLDRPSLGTLIRNLWVGSLEGTPRFPAVVSNSSFFAAAAHHRLRASFDERSDGRNEAIGGSDAASARWFPDGPLLNYFADGADFASMYVSADPQHASGLRRGGGSSLHGRSDSSGGGSVGHSCSGVPEFGVERRSAGYDASGSWIGIDEWMLRCVELQYAVEFHYQWVRLASHLHEVSNGSGDKHGAMGNGMESRQQMDQAAMRDDPLDWDDATSTPAPLPSTQLQQTSPDPAIGTVSASSSSAEWMNMATSMTLSEAESFPQSLGFLHITDFFALRSAGLSPQEAARPLLRTLVQELGNSSNGSIDPENSFTETLIESIARPDLLAGDWDTDFFSHPALFARSGAIDLVFGPGLDAGDNPPPPNAVPAAAAALAAFGQAIYQDDQDDDDDDDDDDDNNVGNGEEDNDGIVGEGARRAREEGAGAPRRATLDVADVFGHVSYDARTLYKNDSRLEEGVHLNGNADPRRESRESAMRQAIADKKNLHQQRQAIVPTLGSLLANLRSVLAMCPRIRLLGLTGFLERAVAGERETVGLSELRHLSLGPPPLYWSSALRLNQATFSQLRSIHIAGCMLFRSEARALGGYDGQLPQLREVAWSLSLAHLDEHPVHVVEALSFILGAVRNPDGRGGGPTRRRKLKNVTATLNPDDVLRFRTSRTIPDSVKNDERLTLVECANQEQDANMTSVRQWWERKAGIHAAAVPATGE